MAGGAFDRYGYGPVAGFYDELAAWYSLGRIPRSKRIGLDSLEPGDRVLFAGVGRGEDALQAARRGVRVTGIDVSHRMLARARSRFAREGLEAEWIQGDATAHAPTRAYDAVVAHYFLNLFDENRAAAALAGLARALRPDGLIVIADFARPTGAGLARLLAEVYYRPVNWIAWALGLCALHPILDYDRVVDSRVLRIVSRHRLALLRGGDPAYEVILARRIGD